jgi:hypothetical protein
MGTKQLTCSKVKTSNQRRKNMFKKAVVLMALVALSACSSEPKSVDYYRSHETERKELVNKFKSNPEKYQANGDVKNAVTAERQINSERVMKYTPPTTSSEGAGTMKLK